MFEPLQHFLQHHQWAWVPPLMCLVLTGIHGYLGLHVIMRKVIFVDLAMAQLAALGSTYGLLLGYDPRSDPAPSYLFALAFTLVGAAVISFTRMRSEKVPQEAFIGIVYAVATALAILILTRVERGGEHLQHMLIGRVQQVDPATVGKTALIYAAVGLLHFMFRRPFFRISREGEPEGLNVRLWDFLFYATFGVVITSSVAIAGVLLVFSYLVIPAVIAVMFADRTGPRIAIAWTVGAVVSVGGMPVAYHANVHYEPTVVASLAVLLILAGFAHAVRESQRRAATALKVVLGSAAAFGFIWATAFLARTEPHEHDPSYEQYVRALEGDDEARQIEAIDHLRDPHALKPMMALLERTKSPRVLEHLAEILPTFGDASVGPSLLRRAGDPTVDDADVRADLAIAALSLGQAAALPVLIDILASDEPLLTRRKAQKALESFTGLAHGADGTAWRLWWSEHGDHLVWRPEKRKFE